MIWSTNLKVHVMYNKKEGHRGLRQKTEDRGMKEECKSMMPSNSRGHRQKISHTELHTTQNKQH